MRNLIIAAAAIAAAGSASASAQTLNAPTYETRQFDVAGIKLGMSSDEATAQMRERGFTVQERTQTVDYAKLVQREADRLRRPVPAIDAPAGPGSILGSDAGGNRLEVTFIPTAEGAKVATVKLTFDANTNVISSLKDDLVERYGSPTRAMLGAYGVHWCSIEETECGPVARTAKLQYVPSLSHSLTLSDHRAMVAARNHQIAALFEAPSGERQRQLLAKPN